MTETTRSSTMYNNAPNYCSIFRLLPNLMILMDMSRGVVSDVNDKLLEHIGQSRNQFFSERYESEDNVYEKRNTLLSDLDQSNPINSVISKLEVSCGKIAWKILELPHSNFTLMTGSVPPNDGTSQSDSKLCLKGSHNLMSSSKKDLESLIGNNKLQMSELLKKAPVGVNCTDGKYCFYPSY